MNWAAVWNYSSAGKRKWISQANPSFIRRMREQLQNCCAFVFDVKASSTCRIRPL